MKLIRFEFYKFSFFQTIPVYLTVFPLQLAKSSLLGNALVLFFKNKAVSMKKTTSPLYFFSRKDMCCWKVFCSKTLHEARKFCAPIHQYAHVKVYEHSKKVEGRGGRTRSLKSTRPWDVKVKPKACFKSS